MQLFVGILPLRHGVLKKADNPEDLNINHSVEYAKFYRNSVFGEVICSQKNDRRLGPKKCARVGPLLALVDVLDQAVRVPK